MLESAAWEFSGLARGSLLKENGGVRTHCWQQSQRAQTGQGFPGEYTQDNSRIKEAVSGRRAFGAEAVLDPRGVKEVQFSDPPREKENQADPENQSQHHPGSPLRHKQEERSRPDYGPGMAIRRNQM